MAAVWRFRYLIGLITIVGAVIGVLMALATPHKFYAESRLFLDPREIRLTEDDVRNQQLSTEAMLAIIDSQLQILSSTSVLQKVIDDLGLERDPEFNGSRPNAGIGAGINLIRELISGKEPASDSNQRVLEELRDSLAVSRDSKTFVIIVGVDTRDPEKSALIANKVVDTYLDSEGEAQSGLLERTSESIDTRINSLREDLDEAERAVERFKAENGIVGVAGQYIDDKEILAVSDQLANARAVKVGIRIKAQNLAKANPEDVLSGAFPEEYLSSNLVNLRKQYTQTKSTADALATQLGPRHPQYVTAKSSLDTTRSEIIAELRRIVASSQLELQRAVETEQELASQMAVAKSRAMDQSVEFVTLRELERKATATREIYEAFLKRSRETSERSNLSTRNIRVISPAEPPLQPTGPSRKLIAIGGMVTGFLAGLGLALLFGAVESIRSHGGPGAHRRGGNQPFDPYPGAPDPGRRGVLHRDADSFRAAADYDTAPLARGGAFGSRAGHDEVPFVAQSDVKGPPADAASVAADDTTPAPASPDLDTGNPEAQPAPHADTPAMAQASASGGFASDPAQTTAPQTAAPNTAPQEAVTGQPATQYSQWPQTQQASTPSASMAQPMGAPGFLPAPQPQVAPHSTVWQTQAVASQPGHFAPAPGTSNGQAMPPPYPVAQPPVPHHPHAQHVFPAGLVAAHPVGAAQSHLYGQPQPQAYHQPVPQPPQWPQPQSPVWPQQIQPAAWPQPVAPAMPPQPAPQLAPMPHAGMAPPMPNAPFPSGVQQMHPGMQAAYPAQSQPAVQPQQPPQPQQSAWQAASSQPAAAPSVSPPAAQSQAVERIWRDMDALKSRIGGYGGTRRRA